MPPQPLECRISLHIMARTKRQRTKDDIARGLNTCRRLQRNEKQNQHRTYLTRANLLPQNESTYDGSWQAQFHSRMTGHSQKPWWSRSTSSSTVNLRGELIVPRPDALQGGHNGISLTCRNEAALDVGGFITKFGNSGFNQGRKSLVEGGIGLF